MAAPHPESPLARAKARALRLLASRPRTEVEIRRRLGRDGLGEVADETVAWLVRLGYLDDAAYARARARSLTAPGRLGPRLAERRLAAAGIPPAEARRAVAEAIGEGSGGAGREAGEAALARELVRRRLHGEPVEALDERERARLARWLLGRGFSGRAAAAASGAYVDSD